MALTTTNLAARSGTLRMDHREAIRYVCLRSDFETARVDGRTLLDVFLSGVAA